MGERGPVPKRSSQRLGHTSKAKREAPARPQSPARPEPPAAGDGWHPVALQWYLSLASSAQSQYYEPSDWALAHVLAESMSREFGLQVSGVTVDGEPVLAPVPPKGASLTAWLRGMTALLVTEGDRRRVQVEVQRAAQKATTDEAVAILDDYRGRRPG